MNYVWIIEGVNEPIIFSSPEGAYDYLYSIIEEIEYFGYFAIEPLLDFLNSSYRQSKESFGFLYGTSPRWARRVEVQD